MWKKAMALQDIVRNGFSEISADFAAELPPNPAKNSSTILLEGMKIELAAMLNQMDGYFYLKDKMGRYIYVNKNAQNLFGTAIGNIIGHDDSHFFSSDVLSELKHNDRRVIELGETIKQEEKIILKSTGETRICQSIKQPIRDDQGHIIGLFGISTDITRFRQSENTLNQIIAHLTLTTRASGVGIWNWNIVENKLVWDDQMFVLYGLTKDNFRGIYEDWRVNVYPQDLQNVEKEIQAALNGEKNFDTEFRICIPDGTIRTIRVLATVIRDASGKALHMIGANWDITHNIQPNDFMLLASMVYQSSSEAIMVTDEHNIIRHVNPACREQINCPGL